MQRIRLVFDQCCRQGNAEVITTKTASHHDVTKHHFIRWFFATIIGHASIQSTSVDQVVLSAALHGTASLPRFLHRRPSADDLPEEVCVTALSSNARRVRLVVRQQVC